MKPKFQADADLNEDIAGGRFAPNA